MLLVLIKYSFNNFSFAFQKFSEKLSFSCKLNSNVELKCDLLLSSGVSFPVLKIDLSYT